MNGTHEAVMTAERERVLRLRPEDQPKWFGVLEDGDGGAVEIHGFGGASSRVHCIELATARFVANGDCDDDEAEDRVGAISLGELLRG